jgi:hypothetical protein
VDPSYYFIIHCGGTTISIQIFVLKKTQDEWEREPWFFLEKRQGICRSFIRRGREPWFCDVIFAPYI